jgi:serine/threonine-protein kinase
LLAGRYRLVALLGRGGMGEVYRADDTKLGQTVALKFLPDAVARDAAVLDRFYAEVRIGRQVSHPNVCRLYDLIEIDGHHCLSMEFVDGEDLSSLLSRIGRLPADKAVDIARDLCAGLGAAHDKGVIHRDLKPANIMVDGKGRARIADFGIAALAEDIDGQPFAGTPAYTAPEILAGKPASVRSDLYALGLVLYEACTGKRLFEARSLAELKALQESAETPSLSSSVRDIPVALERAVLMCLEKNPEARPASAHDVMAALPGGDPLQAAVAAGETPSPAMVAAAGTVGDLDAGKAWALVLAALAGLLLTAYLAGSSTLIGRAAPEKSPEVLTEKAREILDVLGYRTRPVGSSGTFWFDQNYLPYIAEHDRSPRRWDHIAAAHPGPMTFVYRQSPQPLLAVQTQLRPLGPSESGRITPDDPPATTPGMVDVTLDGLGHLLGLRAIPLASDVAIAAPEPDWNALITAAGLKLDTLTPTPPRALAPMASDSKIAWNGTFPGQPGVALHIEAAALNGRPVWFEVKGPWFRPASADLPLPFRVTIWMLIVVSVFVWVVIGVQVQRNLHRGRGDRVGAMRLSAFLLVCSVVGLTLRADHVPLAFEEVNLLTNVLAHALLYAVMTWLIYMALEPIARRQWPQLMVGWSRLLAGRLRDPLVARDVLIGGLGGVALMLLLHLSNVVPGWLGWPSPAPRVPVITTITAIRHVAFYMLWNPYPAVCIAFATLLGLYLNYVLLRARWLSLLLEFVALYFIFSVFVGSDEIVSAADALFTALYLVIVLRAGLLPAIVSFYFFLVLAATPLTLDLSSWFANRTVASLALLVGMLVYGFYFSLGGKSMFGSTELERNR